MAIQAAAGHGAQRTAAGGPGGRQTADLQPVACIPVAFLAKEGRPGPEKVRYRRAVRLMAEGAVLGDGFVVVHKRPPLFHMAGEARLIDAALDQHLRIVPVGVMAG